METYISELDTPQTARVIPDKFVRVGTLTLDNVLYYRYKGYVWSSNSSYIEEGQTINGNTYYVGMIVPSSFQFRKSNTIRYSHSVQNIGIDAYFILTDTNDNVVSSSVWTSMDFYSAGNNTVTKQLVDFIP